MQASARVSLVFVLCLAWAHSGGPVMAGQSPTATLDAVNRFNDAINRHDAAAVAAMLTDDSVFENTGPVPDGTRVEGKAAVAAFWARWLVANADARFDAEEVIVAGDRCTVRWIYRKMRDGKPWHLRGIDVFTVRDGKIAAKLSYVKG
jgi:ketosteroid isomerase-like protein